MPVRRGGRQEDEDVVVPRRVGELPEIESWDEISVRKLLKTTADMVKKTLPVLENDREEIDKLYSKTQKMFITSVRSQIVQAYQAQLLEKLEGEEHPDVKVIEAETDDEAIAITEKFKKKFEEQMEKYEKSLTDEKIKRLSIFEAHNETITSIFADYGQEETAKRKKEANKNNKTKGKNNSRKRESFVGVVNEEGEDDNEEEYIPTIDPVTKGPISHPVKNSNCGHIYDLQSIKKMMEANRKFKCPYVGCGNMYPLRPDQFVEDPVMASKIKAKILRQQNKEKNGGSHSNFQGRNARIPSAVSSTPTRSSEDEEQEDGVETEVDD